MLHNRRYVLRPYDPMVREKKKMRKDEKIWLTQFRCNLGTSFLWNENAKKLLLTFYLWIHKVMTHLARLNWFTARTKIHQSIEQSINRSVNESTNQSINPSTKDPNAGWGRTQQTKDPYFIYKLGNVRCMHLTKKIERKRNHINIP